MSTWTCKRSIVTLVVTVGLSACSADSSDGGFSLFEPIEQQETPDGARKNHALRSAKMARGEIAIVPPNGFCLDKRVHSRDFTVLARCDSLGGRGGAQDAALGMISVAVAPAADDDVAAHVLTALVQGQGEIVEMRQDGDVALAHLRGDVPDGADPAHWRGVIRIGSHMMSMAAYAPPGGVIAGAQGQQVLSSLAMRSHDASLASDLAGNTATGAPETRKGLGGLLRGLLD
ncbi:hypothetical protein E4Z66_06450 [Aliishimia ponticola]|uniref:Dihydroxy-acid dehydratase n=1 Tax=Aliishimia ponticola TaxID=2499833 RepID=A0A4S4NDI1_9RHOB|nr:hypothetical protein [Aliishimia ponticola]THH36587.1 hypothetical protein E4Z66_06450 [Aliishimia ponticola]